jgi:hypothetical protein
MRRFLLAGGAAALLLAPAAGNAAGTATVSAREFSDNGHFEDDLLQFAASGSTNDNITLTEVSLGLQVTDPGVLIAGTVDPATLPDPLAFPPAISVCQDADGTRTCQSGPLPCVGGLGSATCDEGPINPTGDPEWVVVHVDAGDGDDVVSLPWTIDLSAPEAVGGAGDDDLAAGVVEGGPGADILRGGFVDYSDAPAGVSVTDNGAADDGAPGEGDDVVRGAGPFGITGSPFADTISLAGSGSASSGYGDDVIDVRNGIANEVVCGAGEDTATVDALDAVSSDCEHLTVG